MGAAWGLGVPWVERVGNSESVLPVAGFEKCLQRARPSAELGTRSLLLRMICR